MLTQASSIIARIAALFVLLLLATNASYARCYFLECEPGPGNEPADPLPPPRTMPPRSPATPTVEWPSTPYETCNRAGAVTYCASSVLAPQYGFSYGPDKIADSRLDTAWVPGQGVHGDGVGEWILVKFDSPQAVSTVELLNGYRKNAGIFSRNNRVRDLEIVTSSGDRRVYSLEGGYDLETLSVGGEKGVEWIQFIIRSVYRGTKYRDTAISELRVH